MKKDAFKIFSLVTFIVVNIFFLVICIPIAKSIFSGNSAEFKSFIDSLGPFGFVAMMFIQVAQIIVALIPGEVIEFVAGTIYGWFGGLVFCLVGVALGQSLIFIFVRRLGKDFVEKVAGSGAMQRFKFLQDSKKVNVLLFVLYFIPGTPKDLLTYIAPLTKIKLCDFLLITLIARIPSVVSSTIAGSAFGKNDIRLTVAIYAGIAFFSMIGTVLYKFWEKKAQQKNKQYIKKTK